MLLVKCLEAIIREDINEEFQYMEESLKLAKRRPRNLDELTECENHFERIQSESSEKGSSFLVLQDKIDALGEENYISILCQHEI
jgi:hypothetical protein